MRGATDRQLKVCLRALPCRLRAKAVTQQDCLPVSENTEAARICLCESNSSVPVPCRSWDLRTLSR